MEWLARFELIAGIIPATITRIGLDDSFRKSDFFTLSCAPIGRASRRSTDHQNEVVAGTGERIGPLPPCLGRTDRFRFMPQPEEQGIPTRWSLITRLKQWENEESWKVFFDTYWKLIYGVALKSGLSDTEAEEVVQETVITVAKKIKEFKTDPTLGSFKGWLLTITQWRIQDQLRRRRSLPRVLGQESTLTQSTSTVNRVPDPAGNGFDALWNEEWAKNLIDAALERVKRRVPARQYQIYYLNVVKKLPARAVASSLGVNSAQVYLAKHRVGSLVKTEIRALQSQMI